VYVLNAYGATTCQKKNLKFWKRDYHLWLIKHPNVFAIRIFPADRTLTFRILLFYHFQFPLLKSAIVRSRDPSITSGDKIIVQQYRPYRETGQGRGKGWPLRSNRHDRESPNGILEQRARCVMECSSRACSRSVRRMTKLRVKAGAARKRRGDGTERGTWDESERGREREREREKPNCNRSIFVAREQEAVRHFARAFAERRDGANVFSLPGENSEIPKWLSGICRTFASMRNDDSERNERNDHFSERASLDNRADNRRLGSILSCGKMPGNRVVARYSVWPARAADAVTDRLMLGERIIQTPQTPSRKH